MKRFWAFFIAASILLAIPAVSGFSQVATFNAFLTPGIAVPAVAANTPAGAHGVAVLALSADRTQLAYSITYSGLSGTPRNAHFHRAPLGQGGGVVRTICGGPTTPQTPSSCPSGTSGTLSGVWARTDQQPFTQELLDVLLAGGLYINFHTELNGSGEIRGQIMP